MKYYIPISSLNLDNILQSESISPASFYTYRKTGYKSFEIIPELRGINQIVLFECPIRFFINDNRYNYPVLIEIEDETQLSSSMVLHCENRVCLYNKTLYLTPYNCRIFFFSEAAYKLVVINTKDNKSIKCYNKYHIYPTVEKLGALHDMPLVKTLSDQTLGSSDETQNDKKKGVLYAYLVGQNMSLTPDLARQKYLTQEIYNTYAGIKAYLKTNQEVPDIYKERLAEQLESYKAVDTIECKNQSIFNEYFKKDTDQYKIETAKLIDFLRSHNEWENMRKKLSNAYNVPMLPLVSELHSNNDYSDLIEQVEQHTKQCLNFYKKGRPQPSLTAVHSNDNFIAIEGKDLLNIAINYVVDNELTQNELAANRAEICSKMINQIKNYFITKIGYNEEQWKDDPHRRYALQLYNSIKNYHDSFSLNDIIGLEYGNEFIIIAIFLLYGDSIDSYLKCLLKYEIVDYSMPLALWGALCGYMEMNRDLLSEVMTDETYKQIYERLYGTQLYKAAFNDAIPITYFPLSQNNETVLREDYLFVVKRTKMKSIYSKLEKLLLSEYITMRDVETVLKECKKREQPSCDKARQIFDRMAQKKYNELKEFVSPQKEWSNILAHFGIFVVDSNKPRKVKGGRQVPVANDLFDKVCDSDLLVDRSWIDECATFIVNTKSKKQFVEDMNWFVDNHDEWYTDKKGKRVRGFYCNYDKSNQAILMQLEKYIHSRFKIDWLVDKYSEIPFDQIKQYLQRRYGNR